MSSPVRRSLVLSAGLTLVLACTGSSRPRPREEATDPPHPGTEGRRHQRRRVDDPAAPGADEPPPAEVGPAHPVLPAPDQEAEPAAQRGDHGQPDGPGRRPAADKARKRGVAAAAAGHPGASSRTTSNTTGMPTTAGSWALAGSSPSDAFIVQRLRAAGAIVIAKANLSEWANFRSAPVVERLERHRRPDQHGLRPRPQPLRLELRHGRRRRPRTSRPSASAPRPTARSSAPRAPTASSASSRPSASGAGPASCRSRPTRTPPAR